MRTHRGAILMLVGVSLSAQEPLGPTQNVKFHGLEKETALGKQLAAELHQRTVPIDSPTIQNYLDSLGQKIAAYIPDVRFPFTLSLIADDPCPTIHEPTALPGGYVFVPAGLFVAAQAEDEFAGMLAHALEHVSQRHGTRQATPMTSVTIPLMFMGGWGCSGGTPVAFLASQRSAELEADVLAVQTMARAGFDPKGLVRYIERVQVRPTGTRLSNTYSPMPDRDQRVADMLATIEKPPKVDFIVAPYGEFATARQEMRRLVERPVRSATPPSLMRKKPE